MSQSDQEHIDPPGTEAEMTPQADHGGFAVPSFVE